MEKKLQHNNSSLIKKKSKHRYIIMNRQVKIDLDICDCDDIGKSREF